VKNTVLALLLFLPFSAQASDNPVAEFLDSYLQDFASSKDVSQYFSDSPHFIFGSHLMNPQSKEAAGGVIADIRAKLGESGYEKSRVAASTVKAQIDGYSLLTLLLHRYKGNDEILDKVCSTYGVLASKGGYQIISWQPGDVNSQGSCN
jgi:hypothetical protein